MTAAALPTSRWRDDSDRRAPEGAANRVREAQSAARATLRLSLVFLAAAAVVLLVPHPGGTWLPLHLFLAGGAVLAISATTVFFTVTWSTAPAPPARLLAAQRAAVALGAAGVSVARAWAWPVGTLAVAGAVFAAGLALLAVVLVTTVRAGLERRFDVPVAWYVAAVAAGLGAATLGVVVGTGSGDADVRQAHVVLNVLGLVGLVLGGTLPSFAATVGRARMWTGATPTRHRSALAWQVLALAGAVVGLLTGVDGLAALALLAWAAGTVAVDGLTPRFTRRQLHWAGPRLIALHAGVLWWTGAVVASAYQVADGDLPLYGRPLHVLAVGGLAQILWGSLCYLLPVLRGGGHERLSAGFATTRSWTALAAVNVAAVALAVGQPVAAGVALTAFAAESAVRFGRVAWR